MGLEGKITKKSRIGIYTAIGAVIVIVILISLFLLTPQTSNVPGFVPVSVLEKYTNTTLRESNVIILNENSSDIIKSERVYYNGSHGQIVITVIEYKNNSLAEKVFYHFLNSPHLASEIFGPVEYYHNFSYCVYANHLVKGYFYEGAIGYRSNIVFQIDDFNITVSNMDPIVQAQIDAMV